MLRKLNQKQETFCLKYFKLGNATEAAILAGYNPKYAATHTTRWLKMANISERLKELNQVATDETVAEVIERKRILSEIARGKFADFMVHLTEEKLRSAALQELRITELSIGGKAKGKSKEDGGLIKKTTIIRLRDPIQAIAELNKMEGVYKMVAPVEIDNRALNIVVTSEGTKKLLEEIERGIPPHGPSDDEDI